MVGWVGLGMGGETCWSSGVGGEHGDYQFGRYEERDGLEGEPCGCAGGIGADAVHGCLIVVSRRKEGGKCGMSGRMIYWIQWQSALYY